MKIGAIIQARISSTRLPGKILKDLPFGSGITVLEQVIRRLKRCKKINDLIVATTVHKKDIRVVRIAKKTGVKYFRGSENDVLSRYYYAAKKNDLDVVVRITSDCPCIDPKIIDKVIVKHLTERADYTSNTLDRRYPRGLDVEVFNFDILEKVHKKAKSVSDREHVTPYIYRNSKIFKCAGISMPQKISAKGIRITLDRREDYALLRLIYSYLYGNNRYFGMREITDLFMKKPWLKLINKKVIQKRI